MDSTPQTDDLISRRRDAARNMRLGVAVLATSGTFVVVPKALGLQSWDQFLIVAGIIGLVVGAGWLINAALVYFRRPPVR
jgi:hypothetical protein